MSEEPQSLSTLTSVENVENVVLFVADSTRLDSVPEEIFDRGVRADAIAPSTFTAPSFPSLMTGRYPGNHGVWDFNDKLESTPPILGGERDIGFRADTIWTHLAPERKPPRRMLRASATKRLSDLNPPFVYVEHHKGGHLPYGYTFDECDSTEEFFEDRLDDMSSLAGLYQRSVDRGCNRFLEIIESLEDRGVLDQTLVVFTSDHGEVLGEHEYGAPVGHERPMVPELVEIPLVFAGAGLPEGEALSGRSSGVDIVPTAFSALGESIPSRLDGIDLWDASPSPDRLVRSDVWQSKYLERFSHSFTKYEAVSFWDDSGGRVYHRGSRAERVGYAAYVQWYAGFSAKAVRDELGLRTVRGLIKTYLPNETIYGSPEFHESVGRSRLPDSFQHSPSTAGEEAIPREQLKNLGYLD